MNRIRATLASGRDDERGMTIIEVMVAIIILSLLSAAALGLYLASTTASNSQQRREVAITVANEAMELAAAWAVPNLTDGRSQSAVTAQWAASASAGVEGIAVSYPLWDPAATASSVPALPLTSISTFSGTEFTAETYIGQCYQPNSATTLASDADCTRVSGHPSSPPATVGGLTNLIRVIVVVRWTAGDACDPVDGCSYQTSTLIDPTPVDVEWIS